MWRHRLPRRKLLRLTLLAGGSALLGDLGCKDSTRNSQPLPNVGTSGPVEKLRVLVVDDAELAQAIQHEWRSRTEGEVDVVANTLADVVTAKRLPADVIVFPDSLLGHLVERDLIRPLSETLLNSESAAMQDVFPLTRLREIMWGEKVYALPLGTSPLVLAYRPDLFKRLGLAVPSTWDEYQTTVAKLSDRALLAEDRLNADHPWRASAEPTGSGFGGALLLARAAAYASHKEQKSPLFEWTTLEPLIDRPPFVRALTEMAASAKASGQKPLAAPSDAWAEFLVGRSAMALTWPTGSAPASNIDKQPAIAFAEIPGSRAVFNFRQNQWEERDPQDDGRVSLLGVAGRLAAVTTSTGQSVNAEGLVGWLTDADVSSRAASRSTGATLFRASHKGALGRWVPDLPDAAAREYFEVVERTQSRAQWMSTVRLLESHRYMAAMDEAVRRTFDESQEPLASLRQAAEDWRKITAEVGVARQRAALLRSLGLEWD